MSRHPSETPSLTLASHGFLWTKHPPQPPSTLVEAVLTSSPPAVFTHFFINIEKGPKAAGPEYKAPGVNTILVKGLALQKEQAGAALVLGPGPAYCPELQSSTWNEPLADSDREVGGGMSLKP